MWTSRQLYQRGWTLRASLWTGPPFSFLLFSVLSTSARQPQTMVRGQWSWCFPTRGGHRTQESGPRTSHRETRAEQYVLYMAISIKHQECMVRVWRSGTPHPRPSSNHTPPPTSFHTSGCEAPRVALAACLQSYLGHGVLPSTSGQCKQ